jgi:glutathione S-transferase
LLVFRGPGPLPGRERVSPLDSAATRSERRRLQVVASTAAVSAPRPATQASSRSRRPSRASTNPAEATKTATTNTSTLGASIRTHTARQRWACGRQVGERTAPGWTNRRCASWPAGDRAASRTWPRSMGRRGQVEGVGARDVGSGGHRGNAGRGRPRH